MRFSRRTIILGVIAWPIFIILITLVLKGVVVSGYNGFAVDNNGFLYVGKNSKIDVYDNGMYLETVYETSSGYNFTIRDEKLYIAIDGWIKIMDLSGNLIERIDDSVWPTEQYRLDKQKKAFVTDDARYVATNTFGFYLIKKNSDDGNYETIYHIPVIDYIVNCAIMVIALLYFIVLHTAYVRWLRSEKEKKRRTRKS